MKKVGYLASLLLIGLSIVVVARTAKVFAAACANTGGYGVVTVAGTATNVPSTGVYTVWSRIMVPDTTNNSYFLEINGNTCFKVGDSSNITPNQWFWVNYYNGNGSNKVQYNFTTTSGNTFKLIGAEPNVKVDRVIMLGASEACTPTGFGDNCNQTNTPTPPPPPPPPSVNSFTASQTAIQTGQTTKLSWTSSNATSCTLLTNGGNGVTVAAQNTAGRTVGPLSTNTTYKIRCTGSNNQTAESNDLTITVTQAPPPPADPVLVSLQPMNITINEDERVTLTWSSSNANICRISSADMTPYDGLANGTWTSKALKQSVVYTVVCYNAQAKASNAKTAAVSVQGKTPAPVDPTPNPGPPPTQETIDSGSSASIRNNNGQNITVVPNTNKPTQGLAVLDPTIVSDSTKVALIERVEYLIDGELVQTDTEAPFSFDTTLLDNGTYMLVERVYFSDGSISEQSAPIEIGNNLSLIGSMKVFWRKNRRPLAIGGITIGTAALVSGGYFAFRYLYLQRRLMRFHGF